MLEVTTRFSRLTVVDGPVFASAYTRHRSWVCLCDCGTITTVREDNLESGNTTSCGCMKGNPKHRMRNSPTYQTWRAMRNRCNNPNNVAYPNYGGRGIRVCGRWNDPTTGFASFLEDMGLRPDGMTLDRIDVNAMYTKSNCRWATYSEQNLNKRDRRRSFVRDMMDYSREMEWASDEERRFVSADPDNDEPPF